MTYAELSDQVRRTAAALHSLDVHPGDLVGVSLRDGVRHTVVKLGIVQAGAAAFSLDRGGVPYVERLLARLPGKTKILSAPGSRLPERVEAVVLDDDWDRRVARQPLEAFPDPAGDDPALVTLTSGSTGGAKAVVSTHRQQLWRYLQKRLYLKAASPERYLSALPMTFSAGNNYIIYHLMNGDTVIHFPSLFSTSQLVESINSLAITSVFVVPTVLERLVSEAAGAGPLLAAAPKLLVGGAPVPASTKIRCLDAVTPELYCVYASSAAGWIAVADPFDSRHRPESVGRCVTTSEVQIVDEEDEPVAPGRTGRIRCRGETVAAGFLAGAADGDLHETHRGGFYYPGDLGHFDEQGYLYLDGRASNLIIRGGINIYPEHVENVLMEHEAIAEVAVCGIPDAEYGEELAALVVARRRVTAPELIRFAAGFLGARYLPRHVLFVDRLPCTRSGKVDRTKVVPLVLSLLEG